MAVICPTIMAKDPHEYRAQLEARAQFTDRIHIDMADGQFAPSELIDADFLWWPAQLKIDLHMMYQDITATLPHLISLRPYTIIVHAEADGNFYEIAHSLRQAGIRVGVALLASTSWERIRSAMDQLDHVLIFSGDLGHFGGHADLGLTHKVEAIRHTFPKLEIGWDGGVNDKNVRQLVAAGVDVLNAGGYIQNAPDPAAAFKQLTAQLNAN